MFGGYRGLSAYDLNQEADINNDLFKSQVLKDSSPEEEKEVKITYFYGKDPVTMLVKSTDRDLKFRDKSSSAGPEFSHHRNSCELIKERGSDQPKISLSDCDDDVIQYAGENRRTSFSLRPTLIPDAFEPSKHNAKTHFPPSSILKKVSQKYRTLDSKSDNFTISKMQNTNKSVLPSSRSVKDLTSASKSKSESVDEKPSLRYTKSEMNATIPSLDPQKFPY